MIKDKILLKIGLLDTPEHRWLDSTSIFDEIHIVQFDESSVKLNHSKIKYHTINNSSFIAKINWWLIGKLKDERNTAFKFKIILKILEIWNYRQLKKITDSIQFNFCYSGYNDYDNSDVLTIILKKFIKVEIHRGYKETRPAFSYAEMYSLECSDVIAFNHKINYEYFKNKYPNINWNNKKFILNVDDDWRSQIAIDSYAPRIKFSQENKKINIVILTGVARSDESNQRSGTRQFYIPMIKKLITYDYIVHLHALKFQDDINGVNQYELLKNEFPNNFFIHGALDFTNNYKDSYGILSKYDFGILHNFKEETSVSQFDKINIPHRLYEYQIAEVVPIVKIGETTVTQDIFEKKNCGVVYKDLSELKSIDCTKINFFKPSHKKYISTVFGF
jgi:hypothetical protein